MHPSVGEDGRIDCELLRTAKGVGTFGPARLKEVPTTGVKKEKTYVSGRPFCFPLPAPAAVSSTAWRLRVLAGAFAAASARTPFGDRLWRALGPGFLPLAWLLAPVSLCLWRRLFAAG